MRFAAPIEGELKRWLVHADVEELTFAQLTRAAGVEAERLGALRPTYYSVRRLAILERERRRLRREALIEAAGEVYAYTGVNYAKLTVALLETSRTSVHGVD
ncbi:MAG: hypothetical protein U0R50_15650 [Gaiellales bacterium]